MLFILPFKSTVEERYLELATTSTNMLPLNNVYNSFTRTINVHYLRGNKSQISPNHYRAELNVGNCKKTKKVTYQGSAQPCIERTFVSQHHVYVSYCGMSF